MASSANKDFWLSCGHHLLDRDAGGGLVATDEFLKVYLARPELTPPPEACAAERALHAALLAEPRRPVAADEIAAIADADARENWQVMLAFRDHLTGAPHHRGGLSRHHPPRHQDPAPVHQSTGARHPAQRARRLRRSLRAARGRAVLPAAAHDPARRLADRRRRGNHLRQERDAGVAAGLDARHPRRGRDRRDERRQRRALFRAQRPVPRRRSTSPAAGAACRRSAP